MALHLIRFKNSQMLAEEAEWQASKGRVGGVRPKFDRVWRNALLNRQPMSYHPTFVLPKKGILSLDFVQITKVPAETEAITDLELYLRLEEGWLHRQDGLELVQLVRTLSNQVVFTCSQVHTLIALLERAEVMAVLANIGKLPARSSTRGSSRGGAGASGPASLKSPLPPKARVAPERESTPTARSGAEKAVSSSAGSSAGEIEPPSEPPLPPSRARETAEAAGGTSPEPARAAGGKTPLILKGLGRLAHNALASAWATWLMAMAEHRGGASSVVGRVTQRAIGRRWQQGEALVTYDAGMAQQEHAAFRKRARDLTVELVVTTFARYPSPSPSWSLPLLRGPAIHARTEGGPCSRAQGCGLAGPGRS